MSFSKQRSRRDGGVGGLHADAGVGEPALIEIEDGVDELGGGDEGASYGLTMEAEGLGGDLRDTGELGLGHVDVDLEVLGEVGVQGRRGRGGW